MINNKEELKFVISYLLMLLLLIMMVMIHILMTFIVNVISHAV